MTPVVCGGRRLISQHMTELSPVLPPCLHLGTCFLHRGGQLLKCHPVVQICSLSPPGLHLGGSCVVHHKLAHDRVRVGLQAGRGRGSSAGCSQLMAGGANASPGKELAAACRSAATKASAPHRETSTRIMGVSPRCGAIGGDPSPHVLTICARVRRDQIYRLYRRQSAGAGGR